MTRIALNGAYGRMARSFAEVVSKRDDMRIVAGADVRAKNGGNGGNGGNGETRSGSDAFCAYESLRRVNEEIDVVVDFSAPAALEEVISFCVDRGASVLLAATGYSPDDKRKIGEAAARIPVFFAANLSIGINLLADLAERAARALGDGFDVELVEKHHNRKVDAPSGTALMLADTVSKAVSGGLDQVFDRSGRREPRAKREIGIHAVRGGTVVGEHSLLFLGNDEVIEIRHAAASKEVFAEGAARAAAFLAKATRPGLYGMRDLIKI